MAFYKAKVTINKQTKEYLFNNLPSFDNWVNELFKQHPMYASQPPKEIGEYYYTYFATSYISVEFCVKQ